MKRIFITLFVLLLIVLGGVASLPFLLRGEFASQQLSAAVEEATGRKLTLLKPPNLKFWPDLGLEVEGATISNPKGMFDGSTVSAEKMAVKLTWSDVLARKINVRELTLVKPRLTLVVDKQGRANWAIGESSTGSGNSNAAADAGVEVSFAPITIKDGLLSFSDQRSGSEFKADKVNMTISMANQNAPADIKGSAIWNGQTVNLQVFIKAPLELAGRGSAIDVSMASNPLNFAFSGLARLDKGLNLAGKVDTNSADLRKAASWAGFKVDGQKGLKNFAAKASVDLTGNKIALKEATVAMDGMNAQGSVSADLSGKRPRITAALGVDKLDTNIYTGKTAQAAGGSGPSDWSDEPIDLSGLKAADADLRLRVGGIAYGKMTFGETRLDLKIANGALDANLKKTSFYNAAASGTLKLGNRNGKPALAGTLAADGLHALALLKDFAGLSRFEGKLATRLNLTATGASQRELVSTMGGTASLNLSDGLIRGIDLAAMTRGVRSSILDGWDKTDNAGTPITALNASFKFADGIGQTNDLIVSSQVFKATGVGSVDMLRRRLNFKVKPAVSANANSEFEGLAVPVIVKGKWANPKVYPDMKGILENPQAAFDALSKLGIPTGNVNIEAAGKELKDKTTKQLQTKARDELKKAVGEETAKEVEKLGDGLLKQLFKNNN